MKSKIDFFIAGRTRNKDAILKICRIFDEQNISYYCFLKNNGTMDSYGEPSQTEEEKMAAFESLNLKSDVVVNIFNEDLAYECAAENLLLVLPAGNSGHIEAGIAYGMGKKCYAIGEYEATDSLYNIFDTIFNNEAELTEFLANYRKNKALERKREIL